MPTLQGRRSTSALMTDILDQIRLCGGGCPVQDTCLAELGLHQLDAISTPTPTTHSHNQDNENSRGCLQTGSDVTYGGQIAPEKNHPCKRRVVPSQPVHIIAAATPPGPRETASFSFNIYEAPTLFQFLCRMLEILGGERLCPDLLRSYNLEGNIEK